jgi:hypothetical protein
LHLNDKEDNFFKKEKDVDEFSLELIQSTKLVGRQDIGLGRK